MKWKPILRIVVPALVLMLVAGFIAMLYYGHGGNIVRARAELINNEGKIIGHVELRQGVHGVVLRIKASNLTPGAHGMHFHDVGSCDNLNLNQGKNRMNSHGKLHGYFQPEGPAESDLPNLIVGEDGAAQAEIYSPMLLIKNGKPALLDGAGAALIVHEREDDYFTQPLGGAGDKVACGVILEK
jgi:Cu-Zn family superoxide dismutase